jgi:hypothetical protein
MNQPTENAQRSFRAVWERACARIDVTHGISIFERFGVHRSFARKRAPTKRKVGAACSTNEAPQ